MNREALLEVQGLEKRFPVGRTLLGKPTAWLQAVTGVDLTVHKGETLGLVGESGCGKSTLGRCILRLIEPSAGRVHFQGQNLVELPPAEMQRYRRDMQIVFQDPFSSLNPRKKVGQIIGEGYIIHNLFDRPERNRRVKDLMALVGLRPEHINRYPHQFSGGQRQRICVARALSIEPKLIIADEPVSALDVSIQAQILNLLVGLQRKLDLTYLFISHDLSVVRHISDRLAVMYLGRVVELADSRALYKNPRHPYSKALISAAPTGHPSRNKNRIILSGDVPSPLNPPSGCAFHPRCWKTQPRCREESPAMVETDPNHLAACHFPLN
jgi:oligopeptide/dipeptide ABC transporter ATP-binding protein